MRRAPWWAAALLLPLAACGGGGEPPDSPEGGSAPAVVLPDGWRWESYAGVELGVPADWGWGGSAQRLTQWCVDGASREPVVARPGVSTLVGCDLGATGVDPGTLVENTGLVVAFETWSKGARLTPEGDQAVERVGDVVVRVNAPDRLAARILATVHTVDVDDHGCSTYLPDGFAPGDRPAPAQDVTSLTGVTAVAACRYPVGYDGDVGPLLSSLRLEGDGAVDVVAAIATAPEGGGPDRPDSCLPEVSYGGELIAVRIDSDLGESVVHAYYSGCDHNGFDDGVRHRELTRAAIRPLVAAANSPSGWSGHPAKTEMLQP